MSLSAFRSLVEQLFSVQAQPSKEPGEEQRARADVEAKASRGVSPLATRGQKMMKHI